MRTLFIADQLNQLHISMLKSVLMILAILPISQQLLDLLHQAEGSSQIMIGFFSISLLCTSCIVAFIFALQVTVFKTNLAQSKLEQWLLKTYQHVPMVALTAVLLTVFAQI